MRLPVISSFNISQTTIMGEDNLDAEDILNAMLCASAAICMYDILVRFVRTTIGLARFFNFVGEK